MYIAVRVPQLLLIVVAAPYANDWDGSSNRGALPDGSYFYVVDVSGSLVLTRNGYIQIAR